MLGGGIVATWVPERGLCVVVVVVGIFAALVVDVVRTPGIIGKSASSQQRCLSMNFLVHFCLQHISARPFISCANSGLNKAYYIQFCCIIYSSILKQL